VTNFYCLAAVFVLSSSKWFFMVELTLQRRSKKRIEEIGTREGVDLSEEADE
jgi:hypothetical protein